MDAFFQTALSNALLVTAAAPIIWLITWLVGKPALTHALWLVVLLKLLLPPIWLIPFHLPQSKQLEVERIQKPDVPPMIYSAADSERPSEPTNFSDGRGKLSVIDASPTVQFSASTAKRSGDLSRRWEPVLEYLWIAGSLSCLAIAIIRMRRFERSLRHAASAPLSVQLRIGHLAERLGLSRAPRVLFIPGTLCPILWAVGRSARVLIPQTLWERIDEPQRDAILIHELAHWRRRDHWVRWIELFVTVIYWWHPACWWACHELREAEEQCCDAWVLSMTGDFRHYANALLEAVEFVSSRVERPFNSTAVPVLASGLGQFGRLKRRIIMLKNGNISRGLSRYGIAATLGIASLLLPLSPILAQEAPKPGAPTGRLDAGTSLTPSAVVADPSSADNASDEARQLREARQQVAELTKKLDEAEARIKVLQQSSSGAAGSRTSSQVAGSGYATESYSPVTLRFKRPAPDGSKPGAAGSYGRAGNLDRNFTGTASVDRLDQIESELRSLLREVQSARRGGGGGASVTEAAPTEPQKK